MVSEIFPSTYHQGSSQLKPKTAIQLKDIDRDTENKTVKKVFSIASLLSMIKDLVRDFNSISQFRILIMVHLR